MAWITKENRQWYVDRMAYHFKKSNEQIEKQLEKNPGALEEFADWLQEEYEARKENV